MSSSRFRSGEWSQSSNGDSPSALSRSSSTALPVSSRLIRHRPATGQYSTKNHPDKSRRCAWETSGSVTFILRTRCAHILQETTSQYFGIGKVCSVLCTCPVGLLNLQAPGAGGTGTCGCSIRFQQMLGSARRLCRPGHGRAEPGCPRRRPRLRLIVRERLIKIQLGNQTLQTPRKGSKVAGNGGWTCQVEQVREISNRERKKLEM